MVTKYRNNSAAMTFHVTDKGTSLLGLDAIQALGIDIQGSSLSCQEVTEMPAVLEIKSSPLCIDWLMLMCSVSSVDLQS